MPDDQPRGPTKRLPAIPADLHRRMDVLRARRGIKMWEWVEQALSHEVERQEAEHAEAERRRRSR